MMKNVRYVVARSFKVIQGHPVWPSIERYSSVTNSNFGFLARFPIYGDVRVKNHRLSDTPPSHLTSSLGAMTCEVANILMNFISPESIDSIVYISVKTVYAPLIVSIWRGDAAKVDRSREKPIKTHYVGSRSFTVIESGTIRKSTCDFLSVINPFIADPVKALYFAILI